jgi:hypothetical protein
MEPAQGTPSLNHRRRDADSRTHRGRLNCFHGVGSGLNPPITISGDNTSRSNLWGSRYWLVVAISPSRLAVKRVGEYGKAFLMHGYIQFGIDTHLPCE